MINDGPKLPPKDEINRANLRTYFVNGLAIRHPDTDEILGFGQYEAKLLNYFSPADLTIWMTNGWLARFEVKTKQGITRVVYQYVEDDDVGAHRDQLRRVGEKVEREESKLPCGHYGYHDSCPTCIEHRGPSRAKLARRAEKERLRLLHTTPCRVCKCTDNHRCVTYDESTDSPEECHPIQIGLCSFCAAADKGTT